MADEHTPGPWEIRNCAGGYMIEGPAGSPRVVKGSGGVGRREDAQLIVLAPDLLAACEEAAAYLEGLLVEGIPTPEIATRLRDLARRARGDRGVLWAGLGAVDDGFTQLVL